MNNTQKRRAFLILKIVVLLLAIYPVFWFVGFINGYVANRLGAAAMSGISFDFLFLTGLVGILYYTSSRIRS